MRTLILYVGLLLCLLSCFSVSSVSKETKTFNQYDFIVMDQPVKIDFPKEADYALLHVYRFKMPYAAISKYDLLINGYPVCDVRNGSVRTVKLKRTGKLTLSAALDRSTSIDITTEPGKHYYLRADVLIGHKEKPRLTLVEQGLGRIEYDIVAKSLEK